MHHRYRPVAAAAAALVLVAGATADGPADAAGRPSHSRHHQPVHKRKAVHKRKPAAKRKPIAKPKPAPKPVAKPTPVAKAAPVAKAPLSKPVREPTPSPTSTAVPRPTTSYLFADEFSGAAGTRPTANWTYQTGGKWGQNEVEQYTDRASNASLDGAGHLVITARRETYTGADGITRNWTSARLFSNDAMPIGYAEARIMVPAGQGIWPAFWMLGDNITTAGWPVCGEIDVVEALNSMASAIGTVHGPDYTKNAPYASGGATSPAGGLAGTWHTYAVSKTSTSITWYLDGVPFRTFTKSMLKPGQTWVFDRPQYLLLNVAVGGDWPGPPNATTPSPATMQVDWVHVGSGLPPDAQ